VKKSGRNSNGASWQRDPEGMRKRILEAATAEFARHGLGGARIDRIAKTAGANKRMIYYHVGKKEQLYLAVLEGTYEHIRVAERELNLEELGAAAAIARLLTFTWQYFIDNPEFLALLNEENQHRARHLKRSRKVKDLHSPFVSLLADILRRGAASGELRKDIDPVQLYISIAALAYFYQSNSATLSVIFGRDLLSETAKAERLAHMTELLLAALRPTQLDQTGPMPIEFNQRVKI
jgi:AcrR family transcriptional regulator